MGIDGSFQWRPVRTRAYLGWPVEFHNGYKANVDNPHVTMLYFEDVSLWDKEDFMGAIWDYLDGKIREYNVYDIDGVDAFGPERDIPVLKLNCFSRSNHNKLYKMHNDLKRLLDEDEYFSKDDYNFVPHVTVDLPTLISPPETVLLRPLELWWMDDEPVKM